MVFSHAIDTLAKRGGVSVGQSGKNITNVQRMWQFCSCISKSGISRCVNCEDGKKLYHPIILLPSNESYTFDVVFRTSFQWSAFKHYSFWISASSDRFLICARPSDQRSFLTFSFFDFHSGTHLTMCPCRTWPRVIPPPTMRLKKIMKSTTQFLKGKNTRKTKLIRTIFLKIKYMYYI
jgi:hypothetical protein